MSPKSQVSYFPDARVEQRSWRLTRSILSDFAVAGVRAVVLEVDQERHRLSLGLKASYFADVEEPAQQPEVGPNLRLTQGRCRLRIPLLLLAAV